MEKNKTVYVIIGGTSGIGAELAKHLKSETSVVHVASRQTGVDISDEASLCRFFESVGAFDHLIVTAGSYAPAGAVVDVDIVQAKQAFDIKFWGSVNAAKQASRYIKPGGSVTLTTGMLARKVVVNTYVKTAINAALEATVKVLAAELVPIRVNAVSPGLTRTEAYNGMSEQVRENMFQAAANKLPAGKIGDASDLVSGYVLAIENTFMTGSVIDINGGALVS